MQAFDFPVMRWVNSFALNSETLDRFITEALMLDSVKMLPFGVCMVFLWFARHEIERRRIAVLRGLCGGFIALVFSRLFQNMAPHKPRPLHDLELGFVAPFGVPLDVLHEWSSFPSDNAALSFALAAGIWFAWRPLGSLCLLWALVVVSMPRIYAGYHYPSDIVGGAVIGILATVAAAPLVQNRIAKQSFSAALERAPAVFYTAAFVTLFGIVTMFDDLRTLLRAVADTIL